MAFKYNIIRAFEDERAEGKEEGREDGKTLKLISQVRRKVQKNYSVLEAADMLEEDSAAIALIYDLICNHGNWNDARIYSQLIEPEKGE